MKKSKLFFVLSSVLLSVNILAQTGKYLEFNGVNQYMQIPTHADFNITSSESFTVSCWVNALELKATNARFVAKRCQSTILTDKSGYELFGANSAPQYFATNTPNASGNHTNSLSAWQSTSIVGEANKWTHIAFVVDRSAGKMCTYINGVEASNSGTKDISPWAVNNPFDVYVGCGLTYSAGLTISNYFHGRVDNLRFWKKALSAADVSADMTSVVEASTPGLVAAYDFETVTKTTVPDIKGLHPGKLVNYQSGVVVTQDANFTGRGNDNEVILKATMTVNEPSAVSLNNLVLNMTGTTDLNDVEAIKIYTTGTVNSFDPRNPSGTLLGTVVPATGDLTVTTTGLVQPGTNYLWITYKIKTNAKEGNAVDAVLVSLATENEVIVPIEGNPSGSRIILLGRTLVFGPGDYGSTNYRIPAITTAADGSLVIMTDKRKFNGADLPEDIDVISSRSVDGGKTWSAPVTVAQGTGYGKGFGDAVILTAKSGKLISLFVGGPGLGSSTPSNPIRTYMSTSSDNGQTWSAPIDITSQLFGVGCPDPVRANWYASFCGSGHGLCLRSGRVMVVAAMKEVSGGALNNYAVYSDDEGQTWKLSTRSIAGGDEAKVVELNNGNILMSSRVTGNRYWAVSTDGGATWGARNTWTEIWGNACDADLVRYTSTLDGFDKNRLLHTLPNATSRTNVTMWISYDEGATWPVKKTICPGTSAYSSITILPDGTIGVYLEEDDKVPYKMYFLNFSLNWLTNGADTYTPTKTDLVENPATQLSVSPNPVRSILNVNLPDEGEYEFTLVDLLGNILEKRSVNASKSLISEINMDKFPPNIYILKLKSQKGIELSSKIVKY